MENGPFNWSMMPAELRPNWKRKLLQKDGSRKLAKDVNIEETLNVLEQKEKSKKVDGAPNDNKESDDVSSLTTKKLIKIENIYCLSEFMFRMR